MPSLFDSGDIEGVNQAIDGVVRQAFAAGNYEAALELEPSLYDLQAASKKKLTENRNFQ